MDRIIRSLVTPVNKQDHAQDDYGYPVGIGKRVRALRKEKGLSQSQLARAAGISQPAISFIEKETTVEPGAKIVLALAHALNVPSDYLVSGNESGKEKMLRPEVLALAYELQNLTPEKFALIAATVAAINPEPPPQPPEKLN
jgi:transcriptional regulator with XRE-family HTH domain